MLPVATRTASTAEHVAVEITKTAIARAPTYIAVTQARKIANTPPTAAIDIRREMTIALIVAARKKSMNTRSPVKARKAIVPICQESEKSK